MAMFNKVLLVGNAGSAPRIKRSGGPPRATLQLATRRVWLDHEGRRKEKTDWHPLVFWGPQAEFAGEILGTGDFVMVEGRLNHSSWEDREDPEKTHHRSEVVVESFRVLFAASVQERSPGAREESGAL